MTGRVLFMVVVLFALAACAFADITAIIPEMPGIDATWTSVPLESLDLRKVTQDYGAPQAGRSVDGAPIRFKGIKHDGGIGTHASSELTVDLKGKAKVFWSMVGIDDEVGVGKGSVVFVVLLDGKVAARTPVMRGGDEPVFIGLKLDGVRRMTLIAHDADDGIDCDHADWADAIIALPIGPESDRPEAVNSDEEPTEIAHTDNMRLAINYPRITGATPGRPFLFKIPATGREPLRYSAKGLPAGLRLDPVTGIITGTLQSAGEWKVEVAVWENLSPQPPLRGGEGGTLAEAAPSPQRGGPGRGDSVSATFTIVGGDRKLALTPPMGWNSWNVWGPSVDAQKVRSAADWMVKSGLAAHGYQYINIDDSWAGARDANGEIHANEKFNDMKALADYVHGKGLKLGIYSSPGPKTCGGYIGTHQHEVQDAATYAKWGIDYLKYDWCYYSEVATGDGLDKLQKPYRLMREALDECGRDIVYSICQFAYDRGHVWEWGAEIGGNLWRTTIDIADTWASMSEIGFTTADKGKYAGPGHWNDPDMLVVGMVGWGPSLRPTRLKRNEQITHITLWSLLAAPMLTGCDLSRLDEFTLDLLSNDEVIAVDQDPLGRPARRVSLNGDLEVWARPLSDGRHAVGLFNRGYIGETVTLDWSDLGLEGKQPVRDLWRRKNLGLRDSRFSADVPAHGVVLVAIGKPIRN